MTLKTAKAQASSAFWLPFAIIIWWPVAQAPSCLPMGCTIALISYLALSGAG